MDTQLEGRGSSAATPERLLRSVAGSGDGTGPPPRCDAGEERATALLQLAHALAAASDDDAIAGIVADALPGIVGAERSAVLHWDPIGGALRAVACVGLSDAEREVLLATSIRPDETPELAQMLARREPTTIDITTASPFLQGMLAVVGVRRLIAVPLIAVDTLVGVAAVGWRTEANTSAADDVETTARLLGVADQAASALRGCRLLSEVRHQALHDALTGLPNRSHFNQHLGQVLRDHATHGSVAVLRCDLDRFAAVNDDLGLAAGDELLRQVAARLSGTIRAEGLVARMSGDEFALVLPGVPDVDAADAIARRIVTGFERPFRVDGRDLRVTTSVGIAIHVGPDGRGDRLLAEAGAAMDVAKRRGRNQIVGGAGGPASTARLGHRSLGDELRRALTADHLRVHFQPIVTVGPAVRAIGNEALVRWEHPQLGLLAPAAFLPVAEEQGLAVDIDLWVLRTAAATVWASGAEPGSPYLAVNVSTETLLDDRLLVAIHEVLREHTPCTGKLVLEVIESRSLVDLPGVVARLTELRHMGVRVSLDDFGTGYSTLTWLHKLPIDQVKIDRTFVSPLPDDRAATALVRGVVALCRELGIEVVAEGCETAEQLAGLRAAGCQRVQGYLFGRPGLVPAGKLG